MNKAREGFVQYMMIMQALPKDHPDYHHHEAVKNLIVGAAMGSMIVGVVIGLMLGLVF